MTSVWAWAVVRLSAWTLLLLIALVQGLARRNVRSRGWQLNRAIVFLIFVSLLAVAVEVGAGIDGKAATAGAAVILEALRETLFVAVMMAVACGCVRVVRSHLDLHHIHRFWSTTALILLANASRTGGRSPAPPSARSTACLCSWRR